MPQEPEFEMGGGGLYSTAGDYAKFVRMILNSGKGNGNQVLKPETVELMSRNAMGDLKVTMLKTADAAADQRRGVLPRHAEELGPELHDQRGNRADRAHAGQSRLGGAREHVLLDRSEQGRGRRVHDAGAAVRGREGAAAVLRVREERCISR